MLTHLNHLKLLKVNNFHHYLVFLILILMKIKKIKKKIYLRLWMIITKSYKIIILNNKKRFKIKLILIIV